jgi:hypothetical protein
VPTLACGTGEDAVAPASIIVMDPLKVGAQQPLRLVQLPRLHESRDLIAVGRLPLPAAVLAAVMAGILEVCPGAVAGEGIAHELLVAA